MGRRSVASRLSICSRVGPPGSGTSWRTSRHDHGPQSSSIDDSRYIGGAQALIGDGPAIKPASELFARWLAGSVLAEILATELEEQLLSSLGAAELAPLEGLSDPLTRLSGVVPMAVASNAPAGRRCGSLRVELTWYFSAFVSAHDVQRPKPAGEPYLFACAGVLHVDRRQRVAIEDSEMGALCRREGCRGRAWATNGHVRRHPRLQVSTLADSRLGVPE